MIMMMMIDRVRDGGLNDKRTVHLNWRAQSLTNLCHISDHLLLFQLRFTTVFACGLEFLQEMLLQCFIGCFALRLQQNL